MAKQALLLDPTLSQRLFEEWETCKSKMSPGGFIEYLERRGDFFTDDDWRILGRKGAVMVLRKKLRQENKQTGLPIAAETPLLDDEGRPIWVQPEDMTFEDAEWNLTCNLKRLGADLDRARRWYEWMLLRWPGQLRVKFPILVQMFDEGGGAGLLELSRLNY